MFLSIIRAIATATTMSTIINTAASVPPTVATASSLLTGTAAIIGGGDIMVNDTFMTLKGSEPEWSNPYRSI